MRYFKSIVAFATLLFATSCAVDSIDAPGMKPTNNDVITVMGRITHFSDCDVTTRGVKQGDEGKITSMALAIFKVKEEGENASLDGNCVYYKYSSNSGELFFTIDRSSSEYSFDINTRYAIYVFVNMDGMENFKDGSTLAEMIAVAHSVEGVNIPKNGFPMIGSLGDTFSTAFDRDDQKFILSPSDNGGIDLKAPTVDGETQQLLTIPMKALYAKVNFNIAVKPDQSIEGNYSPQFTIEGYTVNNVPTKVDFDSATNSDSDVTESFPGASISGSLSASGANTINFSFYLPERYLTPATSAENFEYPFGGLDENGDIQTVTGYSNLRKEDQKYAQRFKSKLVEGKAATNVVISGQFRDHQNHYWDVDYTIYLGEDNYGNFDIRRNFEYNNYITIRGIQSSDDMSDNPNGIAIDHRVNVERSQPAIISLRREVLLDSHFEVRPLRIRKNQDITVDGVSHALVEVVYNNNDNTKWIGLEHNSTSSQDHLASGKRKYFTTDLVTNTLAGANANFSENKGQKLVVPINDNEQCVWIYVDECLLEGDNVRSANIKVTYGTFDNNAFTATTNINYPAVNYTINQRYLFPVTYGNYTYYIEYEEEYLHNFDADDDYGMTEYEGMPWGLNNLQLSYDKDAIMTSKGSWGDVDKDVRSKILSQYSPKYDFYLSRDINKSLFAWGDDDVYYKDLTRDRSGYIFCSEIISEVNSKEHNNKTDDDITVLTLDQKPKSAIEYCYNKNKRDANGKVVMETNKGWYLPAIDEIEEIVMSQYESDGLKYYSYARFEDFQDKFYWSCQPAYFNNYIFVDRNYLGAGDRYGYYMMDDVTRARSTKVYYEDISGAGPTDPENYNKIESGSNGYKKWIDADYEYDMFWGMEVVGTGELVNVVEKDVVGGEHVVGNNQNDSWDVYLTKSAPQQGNLHRDDMARVRCVRKM